MRRGIRQFVRVALLGGNRNDPSLQLRHVGDVTVIDETGRKRSVLKRLARSDRLLGGEVGKNIWYVSAIACACLATAWFAFAYHLLRVNLNY
jgi:hypothetical protein